MWPFERQVQRDCLRIGRRALERWQPVAGGMKLVASHLVENETLVQQDHLTAALRVLYPTPHRTSIDLVVESGCLPLILVETGGVLWSGSQVEALARHRFSLLYDDDAAKVASWELRIEHRFGDSHALACGLPQPMKHNLLLAAGQLGLQWSSLLPAKSWGWQRVKPAANLPMRTGWFVWLEQDRTLISRIERGVLTHLNAGAAPAEAAEDIVRLVRVEGMRLGINSRCDAISVGSWQPAVARHQQLRETKMAWQSVAGNGGPVFKARSPVRPGLTTPA